MADYSGTVGATADAIMVSQSTGFAAQHMPGYVTAGSPGFGQGPIYTFDGGNGVGWITYSFGAVAPQTVSTSTGVTPTETSYALYGHVVPLSVFGVGRIGGDIISGPFVENGLATFCISFGVPADPYGTRTLREIAFDSEVVWENGAFNTEAFTFRFYPGRLDQAADPVEIAHWGADAVAYRPQILLWFENLPIKGTKFQKIPYVAAVIADGSGDDVNLGEAFTRLALSPWVGYSSADFETVGVTDSLIGGGLIIAQDAEFLSTIQQFGRFYRNWNILQTDKLRIVDRGAATAADISLNRTTLSGQIVFARGETSTIPRVLELSTIDPEADYTVVPSQAVRPREPVTVSASVSTEAVYLPVIMDSSTRQSLVTYTKYQEEIARKKVTGTAMMYGVEIEPGDLVAITGLGADFEDTTFKIIETLHGANCTVEFTAETFMDCGFSGDPYLGYVVLLMGFEGVDGSQGAPGLTDESPKHHGTAASANYSQIDTAQFKFGTSSLWVNNLSPSVIFPPSVDWVLASSNSDQYTIEAWVRFNSFPVSSGIIVGVTQVSRSWYFAALSSGELEFKSSVDGSAWDVDIISSGAALATAVWYHLAVDKDASGKIRIYRNGVMVGSATPLNSSIWDSNEDLIIGAGGLFGGALIEGWVDELRITKGKARYASDGGFVVPTNAFPREGI
jgi:hypothetical protein